MLGGNLPLEVAAAAPRVEEFNPDIYNHPALHPQVRPSLSCSLLVLGCPP